MLQQLSIRDSKYGGQKSRHCCVQEKNVSEQTKDRVGPERGICAQAKHEGT